MDWTGYPKDLAPDDPVADLTDLIRFLAVPDDQSFTDALLTLIELAESQPARMARVAMAFPREVQAWSTWSSYTPQPPTAAALLDALTVAPDTPVDAPPQLLPVLLNRLIITRQPDTRANVSMMHRLSTDQPWTTSQWFVPTPAVDVDPALLLQNTGARLAVRLTHEPSQ